MVNGIKISDPCGLDKGCSSKFCEGSRVRQTPEEGQRTYPLKCCGNNNKDEDNNPKTLKNPGGHIGRNVVEITTIVRKPLMIKKCY